MCIGRCCVSRVCSMRHAPCTRRRCVPAQTCTPLVPAAMVQRCAWEEHVLCRSRPQSLVLLSTPLPAQARASVCPCHRRHAMVCAASARRTGQHGHTVADLCMQRCALWVASSVLCALCCVLRVPPPACRLYLQRGCRHVHGGMFCGGEWIAVLSCWNDRRWIPHSHGGCAPEPPQRSLRSPTPPPRLLQCCD